VQERRSAEILDLYHYQERLDNWVQYTQVGKGFIAVLPQPSFFPPSLPPSLPIPDMRSLASISVCFFSLRFLFFC